METNKSKTGIDIKLDNPILQSIYDELNKISLEQIKGFLDKPIEFITIDKEVDNESLNSNGIGQTNYVLKIRFL